MRVLFPIEEQAVGVRNLFGPLVSLLSEFIFEVFEELAVSFMVRSEEESTGQVLLSGILLGGFQRLWSCCVPCHCGVRGGKRSVNQSSVNTEVSVIVFDDFDTVLELLEVCLACHMPVL